MGYFSEIRNVESVRPRFDAKCLLVASGCIEWQGFIDRGGYGRMRVEAAMRPAHRVAYILANGTIADDTLEIDHTCRNRACVNSAHLELVTKRENQLRSPVSIIAQAAAKTHCPKGHADYKPRGDGARVCQPCQRERRRERRVRLRACA